MEQERIDFMLKVDFEFIISYITNKVQYYDSRLPNDKLTTDLLAASRDLFYLQCVINDFTFFGYPQLQIELKKIFKEKYQSENIILELQQLAFCRVTETLSGQHLIGENYYSIFEGKVYYRSFVGKWYLIDPNEAFFLLPKLDKVILDKNLINKLEASYSPSDLEEEYQLWKSETSSGNVAEVVKAVEGEITPSDYYKLAEDKIDMLIKNPVPFKDVEQMHGQDENFIENVFKVGEKLIKFVDNLRRKEANPLYLLRDGILFSEIHRAMDMIDHKEKPINQILINRKLLSKPGKDEYYWALSTDALLAALRGCEGDFAKYYDIYSKKLKDTESKDAGFKSMMNNLGDYLSHEIVTSGQGKYLIVDTGLQGSINMLTKYIIENHTNLPDKNDVDIQLFVAGDWFRGVYSGKYESEYYPMMKDIEIFNRSEHLYKYKAGSLEEGQIKMVMGDKNSQLLANLELVILVTLVRLMEKNGRY